MVAKLPRAIALVEQFERAVIDHEGLGAIPLYSDHADEQRAINAERRRIKSNYTRARRNLIRELQREPKFKLEEAE